MKRGSWLTNSADGSVPRQDHVSRIPAHGEGIQLDPITTTVFFGAGADADVGVPTARPLVDEIVTAVVLEGDWALRLLGQCTPGGPIRFETLMGTVVEVLDEELSVLRFLDEFRDPGPLLHTFAWAANHGARLVTVNFSDLQEQAIAMLPGTVGAWTVDAHDDPPVAAVADAIPVIKLHGTRLQHRLGTDPQPSKRPLHATVAEIFAAGRGDGLAKPAAKVLRSAIEGRALLVVGYSGSDDLDITPALADLQPAQVVWCDHQSTEKLPRLGNKARVGVPGVNSLLRTWHDKGVDVAVLPGPTRRWLSRLGWPVTHRRPSAAKRAEADAMWRNAVRDWAATIARDNDPTGLGFATMVLREVGLHDLASRALSSAVPSRHRDAGWSKQVHLYETAQDKVMGDHPDPPAALRGARAALASARAAGNHDLVALNHLVMARAYALRDDAPARKSFVAQLDRAEAVAQAHSATLGLILRWKSMGLVRSGDYDSAIEVGTRALDILTEAGRLCAAAECARALGEAFDACGQQDAARDWLLRSVRLADDGRCLDRLSDSHVLLAILEWAAEHGERALHHARAALSTIEAGTGSAHVPFLHLRLGEIWLEAGDYAQASRAFGIARDGFADDDRMRKNLMCAEAEALLHAGDRESALGVLRAAGINETDERWVFAYAAAIRACAGVGDPAAADALLWDMGEEEGSFVLEAARTLRRLGATGRKSIAVMRRAAQLLRDSGHTEEADEFECLAGVT